MTSKKRLAEQILRILAGGNARNSEQITEREIMAAMGGVISRLLKVEAITINIPSGGKVPPYSLVATYSNNTVTAINDQSCKAKLPAMPITLPLQIGVWRVYKPDCFDDPFIPVEPGQMSLIKKSEHNSLSALFGQEIIAYEVFSYDELRFNRSIDVIGETIDIQLLISDPNEIDDYSMLPLPADMEPMVITETLKIFGMYQPHDTSGDNQDKV